MGRIETTPRRFWHQDGIPRALDLGHFVALAALPSVAAPFADALWWLRCIAVASPCALGTGTSETLLDRVLVLLGSVIVSWGELVTLAILAILTLTLRAAPLLATTPGWRSASIWAGLESSHPSSWPTAPSPIRHLSFSPRRPAR
ncbi:MAG TPA: hypothetical protein VMK12_26015 [Anaeromyxobacteraceae bacterium]|nr:hypothetical protein [Anaeromyxobacteraceae bacterium]